MRLKVPLYKQTTRYTCGPSSVNMVLSYFNRKKSTRKTEFEIWKETMIIPLKLASAYGMAAVLASKKLKVTLFMKDRPTTRKEVNVCFKYEKTPKKLQNLEFKHYKYYKSILKIKAKRNNVKFVNKRPNIDTVLGMLKKKHVLIILIDDYFLRKLIWKKELDHIPHFVVIKGFTRDNLIINDPSLGKEVKFPLKHFSDLIETKKYFDMEPALIAIKK